VLRADKQRDIRFNYSCFSPLFLLSSTWLLFCFWKNVFTFCFIIIIIIESVVVFLSFVLRLIVFGSNTLFFSLFNCVCVSAVVRPFFYCILGFNFCFKQQIISFSFVFFIQSRHIFKS